MEPALMVVGLNHRTAPLAMRERFWMGENCRYEALRQLKSAEGVEEVLVLSTRCRTEFLLWADDPALAANSLVHYLSAEHGLKLSEWEHFYRRLEDAALAHIFRLACSLDCLMLCGSDVVANLTAAWGQARTAGAAGRYLNLVVDKALSVSQHVREETGIGERASSIPRAVLELVRPIFGSLQGREVLLLGAGTTSESCARLLTGDGGRAAVVIDPAPARAQEVAQRLAGTAATPADRWQHLLRADIVICATGCPHVVLTRGEAERIAAERNRVALVIIDIGMPRDVDPEVRKVDGILLYDLDGLERSLSDHATEYAGAAAEAEKIVAAEARAFRSRLQAESGVPTVVALRCRLEEICQQELKSFTQEHGPFTREQDQLLHAVTAQVAQGIAGSLAHELKEVLGREEQEQMAATVARLFHLNSPPQAPAGAKVQSPGSPSRLAG
jgi:glutamyl-tRNA reductase